MAIAEIGASQRRVGALVWRQVRQTLTWIGPNAISIVRPAAYLLLSLGLGGTVGEVEFRGAEITYLEFVFPGLLAMLSFDSFADALFGSANEKQWGVFRTATLRGVTAGEFMLSHILYGALWFFCRAIVMLVVAVALGARVDWLWLPVCIFWGVVGSATWTSLGAMLGIRVDSYNLRDTLATLLSLPLVFSSSAFYDPSGAPWLLRAIARINPVSLLADGMRGALYGDQSFLASAGVLILLASVTFGAARFVISRTPLIAQDR